MLRSCADLFQADRDLAATSYCGTGNFSYRKPIISSITACQMLLKADSLSQSTILCRQMLLSCANLLQADRDLAAASYCGTGNFSYRKPIISLINACQMLLKADSLSQSTILCRQMLLSCANLLQADRDVAAASYCGTGYFRYRKPIISSITAWQLLLLEFDTYDDEINITCVSKHYFALIRKL